MSDIPLDPSGHIVPMATVEKIADQIGASLWKGPSTEEQLKFRQWVNASKLPQWIDQYEAMETLCAEANKIMTQFLNTPESKEWQAKWQEFTSKL